MLSKVLDYAMQGWPTGKIIDEHLRPFDQQSMEISAQDGCLLCGSRIVVLPQGRAQILGDLHTSHPRISRMRAFTRSYVWWPNVDTEKGWFVAAINVKSISIRQPRYRYTHGVILTQHGNVYMLTIWVHS